MVLLSISVILTLIWPMYYYLANACFFGFMFLLGLVHATCLYSLQTETAKRHFSSNTNAEQKRTQNP